jgi:hypothetical protein
MPTMEITMKKIKKAEPKAGKLVIEVQVLDEKYKVPVKKTVLLTDKTGKMVEGFLHRPVVLDPLAPDFVLSTTKWTVSERFGYCISRGEYSTMSDAIEAATAQIAAADVEAIYIRMGLQPKTEIQPEAQVETQEDPTDLTPEQAVLLKKLGQFISLPIYTNQKNPVIKVIGEEKVAFLRDHLKKLRLQALASGQEPLKFIKVVDRRFL